jgi:hypothetical protein
MEAIMTASITDMYSAGSRISGGDGHIGQRNGSVQSSAHGDGTFSKTFQDVNGQMTRTKTVTFADGTTRSSASTVTMNADGSKTITKTDADGNVSTTQSSKTENADGSFSISKEITKANGKVVDLSGTQTKSGDETDTSLTRTNPGGLSETINHQTIRDGQVVTHTTSGTDFEGRSIDHSSTWTTYA